MRRPSAAILCCWSATPTEGAQIASLHIEHEITDLETWLGAFARFEAPRRKAGVKARRVAQPIDDDRYIYVELDFDTVELAEAFSSS